MIDIPIIPANITGGVTAQDAGSQGVVLKIPEGLEKLVKGSIVEAVVIRQEHVPNPLLRFTSAGIQNNELPIATRLALPQGAEVQLKVLSNTLPGSAESQAGQRTTGQPVPPQFQAQVISVDGKPLPPGQPAGADTVRALLPNFSGTPATAGTASSASAAAGSATIVNVSGGSFVNATMLTPEAPVPGQTSSYLPQGANPQLQSSDTLRLHIIASSVTSARGAETPAGPTQAPATVAAHLNAYTKLGAEAPSLQQVAAQFAARHDAPAIPTPSGTSVTPVTANQSFTGIVIGTEKSGEAVVQTPLGLIRLPAGTNLPQGTALTLEAVAVLPAADKATATPELATLRTQLVQQGFGELAALLQRVDGTGGLPLPQQAMPHAANHQFAAKLLWFISGSAQGSASAWLGEPARKALEDAGHRNLLQKLDGTFQSLKTMFAEPNNQGWVSLPFPVWDGEKLQQGMFHLHRDPDADKEDRKKKGSRFMVEATLESTGEMQIDGLVQGNSLDIVIRTHMPMPDDMRSDIIRIFEDTNATTGFSGTVIFQSLVNFPVHPLAGAEEQGIIV